MKKILIFAHKPPPHHGQSVMVQLAVEGLSNPAEATGFEVIHVDARLSERVSEIGHADWWKLWRLLGYLGQAIRARVLRGVKCLYYVPAPPVRSTVYRDWLVMAVCRLFFPERIYHWHAMGLGDWMMDTARPWERWVTRRLLGGPDLSLVLGEMNRRDAELLGSKAIVVVPNAIPDPCPEFERDIRPVRVERAAARAAWLKGFGPDGGGTGSWDGGAEPREFRVLYIGLCHREKGLLDAVEAVALANREIGAGGWRVTLTVAGGFCTERERVEFERRIAERDLIRGGVRLVRYAGFVTGEEKRRLFARSDCLCFPTYYSAESFGLVVLEAMAWGLHVVASRWRTVPELLPSGYPGLVAVRAPGEIASALLERAGSPYDPSLRARYLERYTAGQFVANLRAALREVRDD